jgi:hypothetical protein
VAEDHHPGGHAARWSSRLGQLPQQAVHRRERTDRLGPERGLAALPALDLPVESPVRDARPRREVNVGQELGRHDQRGTPQVIGGSPGIRQVAVRIPQRAVHDDQQALDAVARRGEGTRRMAQQPPSPFTIIPYRDPLVGERPGGLVLLVVPDSKGRARPYRSRH